MVFRLSMVIWPSSKSLEVAMVAQMPSEWKRHRAQAAKKILCMLTNFGNDEAWNLRVLRTEALSTILSRSSVVKISEGGVGSHLVCLRSLGGGSAYVSLEFSVPTWWV